MTVNPCRWRYVMTVAVAWISLILTSAISDPPAPNEFGTIHRLISQRYKIVESKAGGNPVVVVIRDMHTATVQKINLAVVDRLIQDWNLRLVGVENIVDNPESDSEVDLYFEFSKVLDPASRTTRAEMKQFLINSYKEKVGRDSDGYYPLFRRRDCAVLGIEVPHNRVAHQCFVSAYYAFRELVEGALPRDVKLISNGIADPAFAKVTRMEKRVCVDYPDYPKFDIGVLDKRDKLNVLLTKEDFKHYYEWLKRSTAWCDKVIVADRNKGLAKNLMDRIKAGKYTRGAMLIGSDHTVKVLSPLTTHKLTVSTVQDELAAQGASYIVIQAY